MNSATARETTLSNLRQQPEIPVLIVGGGINGVGLMRELALEGVDVLLVEKGDFCAGASAAPSRMIHGGLRYLENGEFRLVRESLTERNRLLQNAPHYIRPLPTTIPIFNWSHGIIAAARKFFGSYSEPYNRGAVLIKVGLTLYDLFTRQQRLMPTHQFHSYQQSLARHPRLNPEIVCTATYYDAWISYPERLGLELVLDAEALHPGARALNYMRLEGGSGDEVTLCDELSGESFTVKPKVVVNATGAWIDSVNGALHHDTTFIGGTKGSHLIIDHPDLLAAVGDEMLYFENADGRICIMFALLGKVLVGSTDIRVDDPEQAHCTEDEIAYILDSIQQVLPGINVQRSEIVFYFCGVRPLPAADAHTTGQISRDHSCRVIPPSASIQYPIYSLIGGKWTTFRAFAEQVADQLLAHFDQQRLRSSHELAIGGGKDYPSDAEAWIADLSESSGVNPARLRTLLQRYGTRAALIAQYIAAGQDSPLQHHPDYSQREIAFILREERVQRLDDLLLRRTTLAFQGELTPPLVRELAALVAAARGWTEEQTRAEMDRAQHILSTQYGVQNLERVIDHA
ncbi:MAG: glycerol-3-phosphate dehydrogenase/oxidase [Anaerolineae bacterium]|nr:glycerol-3-phosphate dehydrogenase/oxidase [Anaerolineae bacterium]